MKNSRENSTSELTPLKVLDKLLMWGLLSEAAPVGRMLSKLSKQELDILSQLKSEDLLKLRPNKAWANKGNEFLARANMYLEQEVVE